MTRHPGPQRVGLAAYRPGTSAPTIACERICVATTRRRGRRGRRGLRSRGVPPSSSAWPAPASPSWVSMPARFGIPTPIGSATSGVPTAFTGPTHGSSAGADPVPLGSNNSGRGVGGSMIHYAGYAPRFHPSDFRTATVDGVGADWPIGYEDLKPYYEAIEEELPVSGQSWPWGDPHRYPLFPPTTGRQRRGLCAWRPCPRYRDSDRSGGHRQRSVRQSAPLHLPRILPARLQGERQGLAPDHPHS